MNVKKKIKLNFLGILLLLAPFCLKSEYDEFEDLINNNDQINDFLSNNQLTFTRTTATADNVINVIQDLNALNLFQEDIFLRTNPLNKRNILNNPLAMLDKKYTSNNWISFWYTN